MKSRKSFLKKAAGLLPMGWILSSTGLAKAASHKNNSALDSQPFLGQIALFSFNFAPHGWALCYGQLLPVSQYQSLFTLLGTTYGGDGLTTFGLPDLRGRVPVGLAEDPELPQSTLGAKIGAETHQLQVDELPVHSHSLKASSNAGTSYNPADNVPAANPDNILQYASNPDVTMTGSGISETGGNQPHNNMQPFTAINYCIALQGLYPPT